MQTIEIKNFNLVQFRRLLDNSLIVNKQVMLEFSGNMVKSCSLSPTKTFMKIWTIPLKSLIIKPEKVESVDILDDSPKSEEQDLSKIPTFNIYILKGDLFKKYLSVHTSDTVTLSFDVVELNGEFQASVMKISGMSESNSPLTTKILLSTDEMISDKVTDYADIIKKCTPDSDMVKIILSDSQIQEVKRLIKNLNKSIVDNTSFLTFTINKNKIVVNDKAFDVEFNIDEELATKCNLTKEQNFSFNILKSDFIMMGNHIFTFYTNKDSQKVIMSAQYAGSLIQCLATKIVQSNIDLDAQSDEIIDATDLDQYIDDLNF